MLSIRTAFISAYNKTGLSERIAKLASFGIEIWASGGTAKHLEQSGIQVHAAEKLTGFTELLGGRVKTLHPAIFAPILARNCDTDKAQIATAHYPLFDLVFVDLYPFIEAPDNNTFADKIELIDIGGVSLLRAAAKNFERVVVCHNLDSLDKAIDQLETNAGIDEKIAQHLAAKVFRFTAFYDSAIASFIDEQQIAIDEYAIFAGKSFHELRYGENPHQNAGIYAVHPKRLFGNAKFIGGKQISYNNFLDLDAAFFATREFEQPACAIVKHASPCGIAVGENTLEAYTKALDCDKLSAFGGIVALNRDVDEATAQKLAEHFFECIVAPNFSPEALQMLAKKKNLRLVALGENNCNEKLRAKTIGGAILIQQSDPNGFIGYKFEVVTKKNPTPNQCEQLKFAMLAAKHVKSNAIVVARDFATVGIGGGLPSRVDAAILATRKASIRARGAVAASDAFFPFADALLVLVQAGVTAVIQPGGSKADEAIIDAANELGIAMVFCGARHFRH